MPQPRQAVTPTEFYSTFLSKKSQFKAKEMMTNHFHLDKIAFNTNSSLLANLWNCIFFWILPNMLSGVNIFFCPEMKSLSAPELKKECLLWQIKSKQVTSRNIQSKSFNYQTPSWTLYE
jgi:hypothetical protein